jgi:DtxR family Mn-dependent transcriptional regulator
MILLTGVAFIRTSSVSAHSSTVENYIKQIYLEAQKDSCEQVPMKRLAEGVGVSPGTATSMVKSLARSGLIDYEPRGGSRLTAEGEQLALNVLRRHRLVEAFLVEVLKLDWSEVHGEAEMLEHAISDKVLEKIDELIGRPRFDPHGDPIPTNRGEIDDTRFEPLAQRATGDRLRIVRVIDQDARFLQFAERAGLIPGAVLVVERRDPQADAVAIAVAGRDSITLGASAAAKILVAAAESGGEFAGRG